MTTYEVVGKATPRIEGVAKVTGQAKYAADFSLPGTVWGKCLPSRYSHARIVHIDTRKARQLPGVHAVITGADTRDGGLWGRGVKDAPPLADQRVRYYGERVAAVAADDEDIAQEALELIEVEYEEWPAVFDPFAAMQDGAPILHPDFNAYFGFKIKHEAPSNIHHRTRLERGDVDFDPGAINGRAVLVRASYSRKKSIPQLATMHSLLQTQIAVAPKSAVGGERRGMPRSCL